jgi:cytochrome P450
MKAGPFSMKTAWATFGKGDVRAEAQERPCRVLASMFGVRDADAHDAG